MAKDYFQDITPPVSPPHGAKRLRIPVESKSSPDLPPVHTPAQRERTIQNIQVERQLRTSGQESLRVGVDDIRGTPGMSPQHPRTPSRLWLWGAVALCLAVLGAIALVAFRPTTVTVTPRSHSVLFEPLNHFTAYPEATAASGTLSFILETSDIEDSAVVPTSGSTHVEERASGTIVVVNDYSTQVVKLIKNTRFASSEGLIFRAPADIVVPGKKGATPGEISVTVIADQVGEEYNVAAQTRWTLPGLKSDSGMYAKVYARSAAPMRGGFSGERPGTEPGALEAARAEVRDRLDEKARASVRSRVDAAGVTFPGLLHIVYESLPDTDEAGGGLRIHERAHIELPVFPADLFAHVVAESVSADAEAGGITLKAGSGLTAGLIATEASLSGQPLDFTLEGGAQLIWIVDSVVLAETLAGRDEAAFETVINSFPTIQEAHARIEPFWESSFPADPSDIKIRIEEPETAPGA